MYPTFQTAGETFTSPTYRIVEITPQACWFQGVNLKEHAPRRTYFKWRKDLLKYGIDIKKAPAKDAELLEVCR